GKTCWWACIRCFDGHTIVNCSAKDLINACLFMRTMAERSNNDGRSSNRWAPHSPHARDHPMQLRTMAQRPVTSHQSCAVSTTRTLAVRKMLTTEGRCKYQ